MEVKITTAVEQRSEVAQLISNINSMCNSNSIDDVIKNFLEAKDRMIAIYNFNVERLEV